MTGFNINTSFNTLNFDKSIDNFNKLFENSTAQFNENIGEMSFSDVFNNIGNNETKSISPTAQMAQDIGSSLKSGIENLNSVQRKADTDFETYASGGDISVHEVMISAEKSNLAMQMAIQLRNQALNAYNDFKNMQI